MVIRPPPQGVITSFELCYRARWLGERVRRGESEGEKVARRAREDHAGQRDCGDDNRRRRRRPTGRDGRKRDRDAGRTAGLRTRAVLVALGSVVRGMAGGVSRGGSRRAVVHRTAVRLRAGYGEAEPQRQGRAQQANGPMPLHATRNLRDIEPGALVVLVVMVHAAHVPRSALDPGQPRRVGAIRRIVRIE
jgi:hypothetical protein